MSKRIFHSLLFCCLALLWLAGSWGFAQVSEQGQVQLASGASLFATADAGRFARDLSGELRDAAAWTRTQGGQEGSKVPRPLCLGAGLAAAPCSGFVPPVCGRGGVASVPGCGQGLFPGVHLISLRI